MAKKVEGYIKLPVSYTHLDVYKRQGEFPTYENKGIIVEQRYAKKNNLKVGMKLNIL